MKPEQLSIGTFIDGGYYAKINEGLGKQLSMRLDIKNLFLYVREKIASAYSLPLEDIQVTEAHFFRGRYRANDANAKHTITISVPGMTKHWKNIMILHYSTIRCVWETIVPKVDYDKKTLTFEIQDLSPLAIYADIEGEGADTDKEFAKTGSVSSSWMMMSAMALIVLGASVVVSQKKRG